MSDDRGTAVRVADIERRKEAQKRWDSAPVTSWVTPAELTARQEFRTHAVDDLEWLLGSCPPTGSRPREAGMKWRVAHPMHVRRWEKIVCACLTRHRLVNEVRTVSLHERYITQICECRMRRVRTRS